MTEQGKSNFDQLFIERFWDAIERGFFASQFTETRRPIQEDWDVATKIFEKLRTRLQVINRKWEQTGSSSEFWQFSKVARDFIKKIN